MKPNVANIKLSDKTIDELREKNETAVNWLLDTINKKKQDQIIALKGLARKYNVPFATFVIACTIARPGVTTAIVGTQKLKHLLEAVEGVNLKISGEDIDALENIIV